MNLDSVDQHGASMMDSESVDQQGSSLTTMNKMKIVREKVDILRTSLTEVDHLN